MFKKIDSVLLLFYLFELYPRDLLVYYVVKGQKLVHDLFVLQLEHDLHELSDFGIIYVMVGFAKKSCKIVVELDHLFDFDLL